MKRFRFLFWRFRVCLIVKRSGMPWPVDCLTDAEWIEAYDQGMTAQEMADDGWRVLL